MVKIPFKKSLAIMVILLFIGSAIIPIIDAQSIKIEELSEKQEVFSEKDVDNLLYETPYQGEYVPGEIIVKFKDELKITPKNVDNYVSIGLKSIDKINEKFGVKSVESLSKEKTDSFLLSVYKFTVSEDSDTTSIVKEFNEDPNVEYAEPNYIYHLCNTPNDPYFSKQWGLHQESDIDIDAPEAWDIETGSSDVVIAVVDSGIDYTHPDLKDNIWNNDDEIPDNNIDDDGNGYIDDTMGWDFVRNINDPLDELGHGTHCAGIAGAVGNNGIGIAGVCWDSKIMPVKIFSRMGFSDLGIIFRAIYYAAKNDADIISMSFASSGDSELFKDSIDYAYSKGIVLVASAGNSNLSYKSYPAAYDNVISVAALDKDNCKADFSTYGSWVDVAAPGVDIYSTMPTYHVTFNDEPYNFPLEYSNASGTSMSAPHVAGVVGLILSKNPILDQDEIKTLIHSAVSKVDSNHYIGLGNINAFECVENDTVLTVILDSSLDDTEIEGNVEIKGMAAGNNFKRFRIYLGLGVYPESWSLVEESVSPVEDDMLTNLDSSVFDEGLHTIRLEAEDTFGNKFEDRQIIIINNIKTNVYVDDDGTADYVTITDAFMNCGSGDKVFVYNGTYHEMVLIDRSIDLIGEDKDTTVIRGIINYYNTNHVVITGFTFKSIEAEDPLKSYYFDMKLTCSEIRPNELYIIWSYSCLSASRCGNITIHNNIFTDFTAPPLTPDMMIPGVDGVMFKGIGIDLMGCSASLVKDNIIYGNEFEPGNTNAGNSPTVGIDLSGCSSVFIKNNVISSNNVLKKSKASPFVQNEIIEIDSESMFSFSNESLPSGISITSGMSNYIINNLIDNNLKGIDGIATRIITITNNELTNNKHGLYLDFQGVTESFIHHNDIQKNKNGISIGVMCYFNSFYENNIENNTIGIKGLDFPLGRKYANLMSGLIKSEENDIYNNSIKNNDIGIYAKSWEESTISDNNIENNDIGLVLIKSKNNDIYRNNFINCKRKAKFLQSASNKWDQNYWGRSRILPKLIYGRMGPFISLIPWINVDWHPAKEPYDI